jgi:hypothetical protein
MSHSISRRGGLRINISSMEVEPLDIKQKKLPPTPKTAQIAILEGQVEMLKRENQSLRDQIDIWGHQVHRDRQVAEASKDLAKDTLHNARQIQTAVLKMKRVEREANKEWTAYITQEETGCTRGCI